ncbi:MAG: DUF2493 domain-containing protein [Elusimicrobia bacterium]|nr:DUF2493 domain-containing protein [Elusimicrobiota bacterium]
MAGLRLLVCGGRDFNDKEAVWSALDSVVVDFGVVDVLIEGEASGADHLGRLWAEHRGITVIPCPADWSNIAVPGAVVRYRQGKPYNAAAGGMRNQRMLTDHAPDLVVAFPGGNGTADMVEKARRAGVEVVEVDA